MAVEIILHRMTDTMLKGMISCWHKKEGETVQEDEPLFEVETDKALLEVNASASGVLLKILVQEGNWVEVDGRVGIIGKKGEDIQSMLTLTKAPPAEKRKAVSKAEGGSPSKVNASPAAKRRAKEENVDLKHVHGTGEGGLITEKDVAEYLKKGQTVLASSKYGPEEIVPLEGIRRVMAEKMTLSAAIPQVTTVAETDVTGLVELSQEISVTVTALVVRAAVEALKRFPLINASLDGEKIIVKKYFNIGISVASPHGLIVPALRNAEDKDIYTLSKELIELAKKARENRLSIEEVSGRTFTVTNSGVFGSLFSTPRINPPESAVLGMGKIMKQPVVRDDKIAIRSMMYLSLSYDHRIIDGETAVKFLQDVKKTLESARDLLQGAKDKK